MLYDYVVVTDHGYVNGGLANIAIQQAIGLKKSGSRVLFLSGTSQLDPRLNDQGVDVKTIGKAEFLNYPSHSMGMLSGLWSLHVYRSIKNVIRSKNLVGSTFFIHGWSKCLSPSLFFALHSSGIRYHIWNHDYFMLCPNGGFFNYPKREICNLKPGGLQCLKENCDSRSRRIKLYRYLRHMILRISGAIRKSQKMISIGDLNDQIIKTYIDNKKVIRIDNFIDTKDQETEPHIPNRGSVAVIGRPSPEKGLSEAFDFLNRYGFNKEIVVMGGTREDYKDIEISKLNVSFKGWLSKELVFDELQKCSFLIFPSLWYEGCPLVVQESIAAGIPVLCSSVNAGADIVQSFKAGAVYDPYDFESFKNAMKKMEEFDQLPSIAKRAQQEFLTRMQTMDSHLKSIKSL